MHILPFFVALALAQTLPALSGILALADRRHCGSQFLWLSESKDKVPALAPMTLGMLSASLYAILASFLMPEGIVFGVTVSWFVSVFCVTCPVVYFLEKRRKARALRGSVESAEMSETNNDNGNEARV